MADQSIPLKISIAPFPEGFQGDMDETFQQACILMEANVEGAFLTGLVLPPGSTLPTSDSGPIAMGNTWYFWDPVTNQYLPQSIQARAAKNYCKNACYQIQQISSSPALVVGVNKIYDMALTRMVNTAGVLTIVSDVGPTAGPDYDTCPAAIRYTVGTTAPTLAAGDLYAHEHLIEGCDLAPIQGEVLSLSFLCWVNQPGTYSVYLTNGARDSSYCSTFIMPTASTWTRVKIQGIPGIPAIGWSYGEGATGMYIGVVMALGTQWQTPNLKQWNSGFFGGGTGQTNMVAVTNNQMKITAMRLEASPQCGYASINSFEADYQDCIRYYYTSYTYQSTTAGIPALMISHLASNAYSTVFFPRRMAKAPAVAYFSANTNTVNRVYNLTTAADVGSIVGAPAATQKGFTFSSNGGFNKGDVCIFYFNADARLP